MVSPTADGGGGCAMVREKRPPDRDINELEIELDSFLSDISQIPQTGAPPAPSGLLSVEELSEKSGASVTLGTDYKAEFMSGAEECDRLIESNFTNYFQVLNLPPHAGEELIKKHYRILSRLIHPDKCKHNRADDAFHVLQKAYEELLKPEYRARYTGLVDEAREDVLRAFKRQNRDLASRNQPFTTEMSEAELRSKILERCNLILEEREEKLSYAERTRKANEAYQRMIQEEKEVAEALREKQRRVWDHEKDRRVESWRSYQADLGRKKKPRMAAVYNMSNMTERRGDSSQINANPVNEDYRKAWR